MLGKIYSAYLYINIIKFLVLTFVILKLPRLLQILIVIMWVMHSGCHTKIATPSTKSHNDDGLLSVVLAITRLPRVAKATLAMTVL